jgi:hypothetical protein
VTPSKALKHILTLVEASTELEDDTQRMVLLRSVVVAVAQKGFGVAPDGVAECAPDVLTFPTPSAAAATMFGHQCATPPKMGPASGQPTVPCGPPIPIHYFGLKGAAAAELRTSVRVSERVRWL